MTIVDEAITLLVESVPSDWVKWGRTDFDSGLSVRELQDAEDRYGVQFGPDHREFLSKVLPLGARWPNWRDLDNASIAGQIARLEGGVLFDVEHNVFWPWSWGERPNDLGAALDLARERYAQWPRLIPLTDGRYTPSGVDKAGAPVFSAHQTDVVYYGDDLLGWVKLELDPSLGNLDTHGADYFPPWSMFAYWYEQGEYPPQRES